MRAFARFHRHFAAEEAIAQRASRAFVFAIGGGALIAIGKSVAAFETGSAAMLADAVQSWIGTGTEILLVAAYVAARRPVDSQHPFGYGRESYVWSLLASIGMFVVGAEVGIWRGITRLGTVEPTTDYRLGYAVIAVSFVLQAMSLHQALRFTRERAIQRERGIWAHLFETSDSQLRAVVIDDLIALVGLGVAGLGMGLHQWTGDVIYDALGSILIGVMMAIAGLVMINVNRRFLAGAPPPPEQRARALALLRAAPVISRVTFLFVEHVGPDRVVLVARVSIAGEHDQAGLARILRHIELEIMKHKAVARASLMLATPEEADLP